MGILGRYDDRNDELVLPASSGGGRVWRYDESSESGDDDSSAEGSQLLGIVNII